MEREYRFPIELENENEGFVFQSLSDLRFRARQMFKVSIGYAMDCDAEELIALFSEHGYYPTRRPYR